MVQSVWGAEDDKALSPSTREGRGHQPAGTPTCAMGKEEGSGGAGRFIFLLRFPRAGSSSGARAGRRGDGGSGVKPKKVIIILKYSLRIP